MARFYTRNGYRVNKTQAMNDSEEKKFLVDGFPRNKDNFDG